MQIFIQLADHIFLFPIRSRSLSRSLESLSSSSPVRLESAIWGGCCVGDFFLRSQPCRRRAAPAPPGRSEIYDVITRVSRVIPMFLPFHGYFESFLVLGIGFAIFHTVFMMNLSISLCLTIDLLVWYQRSQRSNILFSLCMCLRSQDRTEQERRADTSLPLSPHSSSQSVTFSRLVKSAAA